MNPRTNHSWVPTLAVALGMLGCSRLADSDDEIADTTEGESSSTSSDESSDASTGSTDTHDASTDSTSSDSTSTTSTNDTSDSTDTGGCSAELIQCPDGTCVYDFPEHPCCSHGGECTVGCEPQAADKGMGQCPGAPEYAWTGAACKEVCPCQGSDCGNVFASPIACLEAHSLACGLPDFAGCPFDEPVAPISIVGEIPGESIDLQAGTFGVFYGKGGGNELVMRFAADELTLANHIVHPWEEAYLDGVLQVWATPTLGVQEATFTWGPIWESMALGTLEILDLEVENADPLTYFVTGTLEVAVDGWDLSGSFGVRHCYPLNQYAP